MKTISILLLLASVSVMLTSFALSVHLHSANAQQENKTLIPLQGTQNISNTANTTNIVLVHGAWVDGGSWDKVIPLLQKAGHRVIAEELPEHSLADDVATAKRAVNLVGGPAMLVGHSYGGFVITSFQHGIKYLMMTRQFLLI